MPMQMCMYASASEWVSCRIAAGTLNTHTHTLTDGYVIRIQRIRKSDPNGQLGPLAKMTHSMRSRIRVRMLGNQILLSTVSAHRIVDLI